MLKPFLLFCSTTALAMTLGAEVVISEIMASNASTLADEDGAFSDWIEIENTGPTAVDLNGWYLTDDSNFDIGDPASVWKFPARTLGANERLIVFASGKNRTPVGSGELHTHFQLDAGGEYLGLIQADGSTLAAAFTPAYPPQNTDVSYGFGLPVLGQSVLVSEGDNARVRIPLGDEDSAWRGGNEPFDDSTWTTAKTGVGFDRRSGPGGFILIENFDTLLPEPLDGQNGWNASAATIVVTDDPENAENQVMAQNGDNVFASKALDIPNNATGTLFFRMRRDGLVNTSMGASDITVPTSIWSVFEAEINNELDTTLKVRNGARYASVNEFSDRTWYKVWMVIDNASKRYRVYMQGGQLVEPTLLVTGPLSWFGFRNGVASNAMKTFVARTGSDSAGTVMIDDIFLAEGENFGDPFDLLGLSHLIAPTGDLEASMHAINSSAYLRIPFGVEDLGSLGSLTLRMRYDDGFVAYLNGTKIARRAAPETLTWNAVAAAEHPNVEANVFEEIDVTSASSLLQSGRTNILAIHGLNVAAEDEDFLLTPELVAVESEAAPAVLFFTEPTPGEENGPGYLGLIEDTLFSTDRGFYNEPFDVVISTAVPGATIVYTTDGSTPSPANGTQVTTPATVRITTTTPLRAFAMKEGYLATNVDTHTYIFIADVINQNNSPSGYPSVLKGNNGTGTLPADYEMDPEVTTNPAYADVIDDALLSIPTISIVTDKGNLFDPATGIYQNPQQSGSLWERPVSFEVIQPDPTISNVQVDAGIRIQGGHTRAPSNNPKHSFRMLFKSEYGASKLRYNLFRDSPEAAKEFDQLILRGSGNQSWLHHNTFKGTNRERAQYIRDQWTKDTELAMGNPGLHNIYAHLYINGIYWGVYNPTERATAGFAASYLGGQKEDYVALNSGEAVDGDNARAEYDALIALANAGLTSPEAYAQMKELLDLEAFSDYMILHQYGGNLDWDHHNWYAVRNINGGKWYYISWDNEFIFIEPSDNVLTLDTDENPSRIWNRLMQNGDYRLLFADRVQKLCFNGGLLTPESVITRWERRKDQVYDALVAESARWGDYRRDVDPRGPPTPIPLYDRDEEWMAERNRLFETYFPYRTATLISQYQARGEFPNLDAPTFSPHGGTVPEGFVLGITAPEGSTVYYTTDGSDPRQQADATNPTLITPEDPMRVIVPTDNSIGLAWRGGAEPYDDSSWKSGTAVGYETTPSNYADLYDINVYDEMFGGATSCYLRVKFNLDQATLDSLLRLSLGLRYDDGFVAYLNGTVVASDRNPTPLNWDSEATSSHSDSLAVNFASFEISGSSLSSLKAGENILAIHALNSDPTSSDFLLNAMLTAFTSGASTAPSAIQYEGNLSIDKPTRIRARALKNGAWSPMNEAIFSTAIPATAENLVFSEIMYNPDGSDETEFLELMNIGSETIDLGGLHFVDGLEFEFPLGTLVAPGKAVLIVRDRTAFEAFYGIGKPIVGMFANDTSLDNAGERLTLVKSDGTIVRSFQYNDKAPWPIEADGDGYSLVLVDPSSNPDHDVATNWRRSTQLYGNPGRTGTGGFEGDPLANLDNDGASALLEYALGTSDLISNDIHSVFYAAASGDFKFLIVHKNDAADDVSLFILKSSDLQSWQSADDILEMWNQTPVTTEQTRMTYRILDVSGNPIHFRLEAELKFNLRTGQP